MVRHLLGLGTAMLLLAAGLSPGARAQPATAEQLAQELLAAFAEDRAQRTRAPEFATAEVAQALIALGEQARLAAEFARAFTCFETAAAVARSAGADPALGRALNGAADALFRQGDVAGLPLAEESVRVHERLNDPAGLAAAWNNVGNFKSVEGPGALPAYEKSLELCTAAGDSFCIARALNNIGNVHRGSGEPEKALDYLDRARRIFEVLNDERRTAIVLGSIALIYVQQGRYPEALEQVTRTLAIQERLGDRPGTARSLDTLGNIYVDQGAYARGLDCLERGLKLRVAFGGVFDAAESWNNIGRVHYALGDYELAIESFQQALRLNKAIGQKGLIAAALLNLGHVAVELGQRQRAEANYRECLRVSEVANFKSLAAAALQGLADMALSGGRTAEAEALLTQALAIQEALPDRTRTADVLNDLAAIDLAARQPGRALERARRAAAISRAIEQPELLWEAHTWMGRAYRQLADRASARRELDAAIAIIDDLREEVVARPVGRERFLEIRLAPFHDLLELTLDEGSDAAALELAERAKARVLSDLLQVGQVDIRGAMSDAERQEERRLRANLLGLNQRLQAERLAAEPDAARIERLEAERAERRLEYEAFETALYASHPELRAQRGAAPTFTLADADRLVPSPDVAILEYVVTDERLHLFVLTRGAVGPSVEALSSDVDVRALAASTRRFRDRLAARDLAFGEDARRLYDQLLAPAAPWLAGKRHVIVVPDGPLWEVPFQALLDPARRYVIESVAVSYAPSLTVLRETLRADARPHATRTVLAMGKAEFGSPAGTPPAALMSDLAPLPDAERQVRLIGELYGPERSSTYVGLEAREDRFKAEAPRYSVLHLASHGVLDESSPFYSHIVLSPGTGGSSADGLLEAWELLDLRLHAELAILSACETGRGRISAGEGTVGMMWALFVAGAQATVVSQWKVEASSTTELMSAFHRGLAGQDGGKAELLRDATLEVLRNPRYAHPFYWAPFVLIGQPF